MLPQIIKFSPIYVQVAILSFVLCQTPAVRLKLILEIHAERVLANWSLSGIGPNKPWRGVGHSSMHGYHSFMHFALHISFHAMGILKKCVYWRKVSSMCPLSWSFWARIPNSMITCLVSLSPWLWELGNCVPLASASGSCWLLSCNFQPQHCLAVRCSDVAGLLILGMEADVIRRGCRYNHWPLRSQGSLRPLSCLPIACELSCDKGWEWAEQIKQQAFARRLCAEISSAIGPISWVYTFFTWSLQP